MRCIVSNAFLDLDAASAPAARGALGFALCSFGPGGSTAKHNTTRENSGLATIVVGHLGLGSVNEDAGLSGSLAARQLVLGRLRVGGRL